MTATDTIKEQYKAKQPSQQSISVLCYNYIKIQTGRFYKSALSRDKVMTFGPMVAIQ